MTRPTLDEVQARYRCLYYGDPGGGKTTAIAMAAKLGKVIYIDADGGLKAKALRRHGIPVENIEPYTDISYRGLEKLHQETHTRLRDGEDIYAIAWDTTSKTQDAFLDEIMPESLKKSERIGKDRGEFEIYLEDRGVVVEMMKKLLRRFHGLDCNLLLGAHERRDVNQEDGSVRVGPALSPSVAASFGGWMDCIIRCSTETFENDPTLAEWDGMEFVGLTRPDGRFVAKDRFGLLPKRMVNPGFDRVIAYLDGDLEKINDPFQKAAIARRINGATNGAEEPAVDTVEEASA